MAEVATAVVLTEKTAFVLETLKETGAKMFAEDIANTNPEMFDKGQRSVNPILTNLVRKGYVEKEESTRPVQNKDGVMVDRPYKCYWVSDAGAALEYTTKVSE